jgi:2-beta-glucuronyltransferase
VRFITCDFSLITRLKGDRRTEFGDIRGVNQLDRIDDSLSVGVVSTPWHPVGSGQGVLHRMASALTSNYPWTGASVVRAFAHGSDLVIVESCGGLFFLDDIRAVTACPVIYRVSDNLAVVRPVPGLLEAQRKAVATVDAVSVASEHLARTLGAGANLRFDPMGLDKAQFDAPSASPYAHDGRVKVVISGSSGLDSQALDIAATLRPHWDFIQFGEARDIPVRDNIIRMGERPFQELVPWVKHADIGFAPYVAKPGFEYQAEHSNRLLQYTYCALPSLVPAALESARRPHFIGYETAHPESIERALCRAQSFDRTAVPVSSVLDWDQLAHRLASVAQPPSLRKTA